MHILFSTFAATFNALVHGLLAAVGGAAAALLFIVLIVTIGWSMLQALLAPRGA